MNTLTRQLTALPAIVLGLGAVALAAAALAGSRDLPTSARSLTQDPKKADLVAPAPEGLSSVTATRDTWELNASKH